MNSKLFVFTKKADEKNANKSKCEKMCTQKKWRSKQENKQITNKIIKFFSPRHAETSGTIYSKH